MRTPVVGLAVACIALLAAACGGEEHVLTLATDSPTPIATEAPSTATGTPDAIPVVMIGPTTYVDPAYGYSYQVPAGWFASQSVHGYSALTSYDPRTAPGHGFGCDAQTGVIKVEFYVEEVEENVSLEEWLAKRTQGDVSVLQTSESTVDGVAGVREVRSFDADHDPDSDQYYFKIGPRIHAIIAYCFDPSLGILSVVLPTVRFLD